MLGILKVKLLHPVLTTEEAVYGGPPWILEATYTLSRVAQSHMVQGLYDLANPNDIEVPLVHKILCRSLVHGNRSLPINSRARPCLLQQRTLQFEKQLLG